MNRRYESRETLLKYEQILITQRIDWHLLRLLFQKLATEIAEGYRLIIERLSEG